MIELIFLGIIVYLLYIFLIRGLAWGILLFFGGIYGIRLLLLSTIPDSANTIMTFMNYNISYAGFCATIITILGLAYFAKDD